MSQEFVQVVLAFWSGFACGVAAFKFGWPRLAAKFGALRAKLRDKL